MEKMIMLGKIGIRKRGRPNARWTDSMNKGMSLQELSRTFEGSALWMLLIRRVARSQSQLSGIKT